MRKEEINFWIVDMLVFSISMMIMVTKSITLMVIGAEYFLLLIFLLIQLFIALEDDSNDR